mmetsp:Transcript_38229/g.70137  ORF Transcript_38229/g.70137 Transcript_38229/m.70137 type:complete len:334 (-) Transcript_38229:435-1436(-)
MKYMLFNLTVLASFIAVAATKLLGVRNSPLVPECHDTYDNTKQTSIPMQHHQQLRQQLRQQQREIFEIGDMVEVYESKIYQEYSFFAEIGSNVTQHDGSIKYEIRAGPNRDELFQDIDSSSIRAHEPLEFKRRVMCDYGQSLGSSSRLIPCTILAYSYNERQSYYVLGMIDGKARHHDLPMSRIRPIVDMSSALEEEFERLSSSDLPRYDDSNHLRLRGVVELYDDNNYYSAAPLIITSYMKDGKMDLHHTFSSTHLPGVDPEDIRPYHVYGDGTDALCKVDKLRKVTPCTIGSHSITKTGSVSYQVSYLNEGKTLQKFLPFTDVQRILKKKD